MLGEHDNAVWFVRYVCDRDAVLRHNSAHVRVFCWFGYDCQCIPEICGEGVEAILSVQPSQLFVRIVIR